MDFKRGRKRRVQINKVRAEMAFLPEQPRRLMSTAIQKLENLAKQATHHPCRGERSSTLSSCSGEAESGIVRRSCMLEQL